MYSMVPYRTEVRLSLQIRLTKVTTVIICGDVITGQKERGSDTFLCGLPTGGRLYSRGLRMKTNGVMKGEIDVRPVPIDRITGKSVATKRKKRKKE